MTQWREMLQGTERCLVCHDYFDGHVGWRWFVGISETTKICPLCSVELKEIKEIHCEECGRPAVSGKKGNEHFQENKICNDCTRWHERPPWNEKKFYHRAIYQYNPFLQEVMAAFKYRGDVELAELFAPKLKSLVSRGSMSFDLVTYIPLGAGRNWERGFNQAEVLGQCFSPVELLERTTTSYQKQSKRTREERIVAMKEAFSISSKIRTNELLGKNILIIDDIYTTGATLRSAAAVLYGGGAKFVGAVTVARAVGRRQMKEERG